MEWIEALRSSIVGGPLVSRGWEVFVSRVAWELQEPFARVVFPHWGSFERVTALPRLTRSMRTRQSKWMKGYVHVRFAPDPWLMEAVNAESWEVDTVQFPDVPGYAWALAAQLREPRLHRAIVAQLGRFSLGYVCETRVKTVGTWLHPPHESKRVVLHTESPYRVARGQPIRPCVDKQGVAWRVRVQFRAAPQLIRMIQRSGLNVSNE